MQPRTVKKSVVVDGVAISVKSLRCVGARAVDYARSTATRARAGKRRNVAREREAALVHRSRGRSTRSRGDRRLLSVLVSTSPRRTYARLPVCWWAEEF